MYKIMKHPLKIGHFALENCHLIPEIALGKPWKLFLWEKWEPCNGDQKTKTNENNIVASWLLKKLLAFKKKLLVTEKNLKSKVAPSS